MYTPEYQLWLLEAVLKNTQLCKCYKVKMFDQNVIAASNRKMTGTVSQVS